MHTKAHFGNLAQQLLNYVLWFAVKFSCFLDELEKYDQMAKSIRREDRRNSYR
ncbi:hypothetical protein [Photobacterium aquae]|uniref:hypothetical protein n=1 Tax=Photobacterium aquae TaxID=1195763 RepID=UPI000A41DFF3|nr:hypothetical protein [Photobacterium aquae]